LQSNLLSRQAKPALLKAELAHLLGGLSARTQTGGKGYAKFSRRGRAHSRNA
jgi:hypothetical protein